MWKVGDRIVITHGVKDSSGFKTAAKGTVQSLL